MKLQSNCLADKAVGDALYNMSRQPTSSLQMASLPVMKNYRLTEKLGSGTFATVYKAYEKVGGSCV